MERDEHEMLIEYSEMTTFNFNSEEYLKAKRDYEQCRDFVSNISWFVSNVLRRLLLIKSF